MTKPIQFNILEPDLHYLQRFPVNGRGYLFNYGDIADIDPYDGKKHTMAEMVKGILNHDPYIELMCQFAPANSTRLSDALTRCLYRLLPKDRISDLPKDTRFELTSVDNPDAKFGRPQR